jgi:hypothetical protein
MLFNEEEEIEIDSGKTVLSFALDVLSWEKATVEKKIINSSKTAG